MPIWCAAASRSTASATRILQTRSRIRTALGIWQALLPRPRAGPAGSTYEVTPASAPSGDSAPISWECYGNVADVSVSGVAKGPASWGFFGWCIAAELVTGGGLVGPAGVSYRRDINDLPWQTCSTRYIDFHRLFRALANRVAQNDLHLIRALPLASRYRPFRSTSAEKALRSQDRGAASLEGRVPRLSVAQ
jgi:hypothetical protein